MTLGTLGRYRLIRKLAQGGMAEVFLAKSYGAHGFEKPVAIKRILSRYATDKQFVTMLIDEAKITSLLSHPNIVPVIDFNADGRDAYLVMEYVPGRSMAGLLKGLAQAGRQLSVEHLIFVVREAAAGLHHAHAKTDRAGQPLRIVHRDVSPQNILIGFEGHARVIDFGIARARDRLAQTEAGTLKGKLRYMSPEQVEGKDIDGRTDQFALGITLWEALTDRVLFDGDNDVQVIDSVMAARVPDPRDYNKNVPQELARAVLKSLHRAPSGRFSSCDAFAAELRGILARLNPDYDPATLGALMRKQFAEEMAEDAREEADAEAELERAGAVGPPRESAAGPSQEPAARTGEPRVRSKTGAVSVAPREEPVRARKANAQKGMRPADARRAAEKDALEEADGFLGESTREAGGDRPSNPKGVVVPVDVPAASPSEVTRHFDPKLLEPPPPKATAPAATAKGKPSAEAPKAAPAAAKNTAGPGGTAVAARPAASKAAKARPSSGSRMIIAAISGVAGMVMAVVLGLVWVARTDATPARKDPPPDAAGEVGTTSAGTDNAGTDTAPSDGQAASARLDFVISPLDARVTVDRRPIRDIEKTLRLEPGRHRVYVSKDGFTPREEMVDLAEGERRTVDITLESDSPPPRDEKPAPRADDKPADDTRDEARAQGGATADKPDEQPQDRKPAEDKPRDSGKTNTRDQRRDTAARDKPREEKPREEKPREERAREEKPREKPADKPVAQKEKPAQKAAAPAGKGTLKVITPGSWAQVELDGSPTGKNTPVVLEVGAGEHTITFRKGGSSSTQKVTVEAGKTAVVKGEI